MRPVLNRTSAVKPSAERVCGAVEPSVSGAQQRVPARQQHTVDRRHPQPLDRQPPYPVNGKAHQQHAQAAYRGIAQQLSAAVPVRAVEQRFPQIAAEKRVFMEQIHAKGARAQPIDHAAVLRLRFGEKDQQLDGDRDRHGAVDLLKNAVHGPAQQQEQPQAEREQQMPSGFSAARIEPDIAREQIEEDKTPVGAQLVARARDCRQKGAEQKQHREQQPQLFARQTVQQLVEDRACQHQADEGRREPVGAEAQREEGVADVFKAQRRALRAEDERAQQIDGYGIQPDLAPELEELAQGIAALDHVIARDHHEKVHAHLAEGKKAADDQPVAHRGRDRKAAVADIVVHDDQHDRQHAHKLEIGISFPDPVHSGQPPFSVNQYSTTRRP